jgi:hypothetical protein
MLLAPAVLVLVGLLRGLSRLAGVRPISLDGGVTNLPSQGVFWGRLCLLRTLALHPSAPSFALAATLRVFLCSTLDALSAFSTKPVLMHLRNLSLRGCGLA